MTRHVLVVDDEEGYRQLYHFLLEPLGVMVDSAGNGQEALERVRERPYDLVLLDVHMPVLDGPRALHEIRKVRPGQKVVIVSSSSDPEYTLEHQALNEGAIRCLFKPVELAEIERMLRETLFEQA